MAPRGFDRMMIEIEIGSNLKIARLNDREFRCLICGVWPVAAKAKPRGYLAVIGQPATAEDVAHQGRVPVATARKTLDRLRELGMLETDETVGLEYCHDWHLINPDPKPDLTAAERQQRHRSRKRNGDVTRDSHGDVTPPEVEGEVEEQLAAKAASPAAPPPQADPDPLEEDVVYLCRLMSAEVRAAHGIAERSREALVVKGWMDACRAMLTRDGLTVEQLEYAIRWVCRHHYWKNRVRSMTRLRSEMEQIVQEIKSQRNNGNVVPLHKPNADALITKLEESEAS